MNDCSHNKYGNQSSCFDKKSLVSISNIINSKAKASLINTNTSKDEILRQLLDTPFLKCKGGDQICDLSRNILSLLPKSEKSKIKHYTYKPFIPKNKYRWLTNYDINFVMNQFDKRFTSFEFMGALSCDYFNIYPRSFDIKSLKNKIGIIFNTSRQDSKGEHWVSIFIDKKKKSVEYFDSNGDQPNECIREFFDRFLKGYYFIYSSRSFQKNNYACGIYSIHFIVCRLKGMSMDSLVNKGGIGDDHQQFINKYFYFR